MVKLRLTRLGAHKAPFYRIIATDSRKSRDGSYIEQIGYYDPTKEPAVVKIDNALAEKWLSQGAQPSDTVRTLLKKAGVSVAAAPQRIAAKPKKAGAVPAAAK